MPRSEPDTSLPTPPRFLRAVHCVAVLTLAVTLSASLGGCDRIKTVARKVGQPGAARPDYVAPPAPNGSGLLPDDKVDVEGSALAGSQVSLRSPEGQSAETSADAQGRWRVILPAFKTPRLYAFDATLDGRTVRAEGALCVLPTGAILVLRAGSGAAVLGDAGALTLADVDFDGGGGVAASGLSAPNSPVRLIIDGAVAGVGQADARGRYVTMGLDPRRAPLSGVHRIGVQSPAGLQASEDISLTPPAPMASTQIYRASAVQGGWRIDWRLPGGGLQTAVVFSPPIKGQPNASPTSTTSGSASEGAAR